MKIAPSSSSKKPTYPTMLAIAAVGAMISPVYAQNEAENPPETGAARIPQPALRAPGSVKAPREPQRTVGKKVVRDPQARAGVYKQVYPKGKGSAKSATSPEKK